MKSILHIPSMICLSVPHVLAWEHAERTGTVPQEHLRDFSLDYRAARNAVHRLFANESFPLDPAKEDLLWRRDPLGKPFVEWAGVVDSWAAQRNRDSRCLHISNSHDGGRHLVLAAYDPALVGIGVDIVWLPRLRLPGKGREYLVRFARRFMSPEERTLFEASAAEDSAEALRLRVAAHFSLMEAASKACGTGLKIGVGMGKPTSLPKQSLGARKLSPNVELFIGPEAQFRLDFLNAARYEACWDADEEFLITAVALYHESG